jgi:hypothetical protein
MNSPLRSIQRLIIPALAVVIAAGLTGCGSGGTATAPTLLAAAITTLSPATATVGAGAFTLTVNGSNFVSGAVVNFNGSPRTTNFVSTTQLTASIPASDVASAGTAPITVSNPSGALISNTVSLTIAAPVNPGPPTLTNLAPPSVVAASAAFTLVVNGSNLVSGAVVNFNGAARTTTFVSAAQVTAVIPATDITSIGTASITVTNPLGGGVSNALTFNIASPGTPIATNLAPSSVLIGSGAFTLTVTGSNFVNGSVVNFNGSARVTSFVSATQLSAAILATDTTSFGPAPITVTNPSGGGTSTALTLTIVDPHSPSVTALTPVSMMVGSGAFTMTVTGLNFVSGALVNFNGTPRTTTFVNSTQLTASILAADVATVGTASVSVTNVSAGATSSTLPFTISLTAAYTGVAFTGTVSAGSQAVSGSSVKLFAAGIAGNGSTASPLLVAALTTDSTGSFSIPAGYTCPTAASQLYVVARDGQIGTAAHNPAIAFVTSLGACNQLVASSHVVLNEVTTVATVWAFSQFLAPGGNIGASAINTVGIANAAATAASLANPQTGTAPGATFPSNALTVTAPGGSPAAKINTLANILNACTSKSSSSTACSSILPSTTINTLDAALSIIHNPAANVAALFTQSTTSTAFKPALTAAPSDWTLYVTFTGGGMLYPAGIGVDGNGNIWVGSYFYTNPDPNAIPDPLAGSAAELSPIGKQLFPSGISGYGLSNIYGLAVDASNNAWITNEASPGNVNGGLGSITVLNPSGQPLSGATGYTAGGINYPLAVAIDTDTTAWVLDFGNSHLTHLSSTGAALSGTSGYTTPFFVFPAAIAIDASHNVWVATQSGDTVTKVSPNGQTFTNFACCSGPSGLAIDQQGNVWVANYYGGSISQISSSGTIVSNGTYTANSTLRSPQAIAIDGNGNVWIGNFRAGYLTELAGASSTSPAPGQPISPAAGWAPDAKLFGAYAIVIDPSGNLWVSNLYGASVTEFIGVAAPVKTPLLGPPQTP